MESVEPMPQNQLRESKLTNHVKQTLRSIREGYSPTKVEEAYIQSYERILETLDVGQAKEAFSRLRPVFQARAKLVGITSLVADVGVTTFLAIQSLRNLGLRSRAQISENVAKTVALRKPITESIASVVNMFNAKKNHHLRKASLIGISTLGIGLSAPAHRGAELYAKGEGFLGEKVAHIVNGIVSGRINFREIGKYKMNTVRVGVGKPA